MPAIVVRKLRYAKQAGLVVLFVAIIDPKVLFYYLILALYLTVRL